MKGPAGRDGAAAAAGRGDSLLRGPLPQALLLLSLVAAVYLQTGRHDFVLLDDDQYLRNGIVQGGLTAAGARWALTTFHASNWHPVTWLSHMLDVSLFGLDPGAFHLVSAAFHGASAVLLYLLLLRLGGSRGKALFAAALLAVHPLHVESVAWVAERKDVLFLFFLLLSLHAWARYARRGGALPYGAALSLFALSLMSKPMAVTYPFLLLLLDAWPLGRTPLAPPADGSPHAPVPYGRLAAEKAPFLALSLASCAVTLLAQADAVSYRLAWLPPAQKAAVALTSYVAYLGKLPWPADLALVYPLPRPPGIPPWQGAAAALFLAAVTVLALREVRRRPYLPVGWLWFLGALVPVIGIVRVGGQSMADRYAYLPFVGLYVAAAWGIPEAARRLPGRERVLPAAACAAVVALGAAAHHQAGYWRDSEGLFLRTLSVTEGNFLVQTNLGSYYGMAGRHDLALPRFEEAVRIEPDYQDARFNLGTALLRLGRAGEAVPHLRRAFELRQDGRHAARLGDALAAAGSPAEAAEAYRAALFLDPGNGAAAAGLERLEGAVPGRAGAR